LISVLTSTLDVDGGIRIGRIPDGITAAVTDDLGPMA